MTIQNVFNLVYFPSVFIATQAAISQKKVIFKQMAEQNPEFAWAFNVK